MTPFPLQLHEAHGAEFGFRLAQTWLIAGDLKLAKAMATNTATSKVLTYTAFNTVGRDTDELDLKG
jgi:hypothetical protein